MKFKKYLALSLAVAMVATSAPQMAFMGLGPVEVKAEDEADGKNEAEPVGNFEVNKTENTVDEVKTTTTVTTKFKTAASDGVEFAASDDESSLVATYTGESIDPEPVITSSVKEGENDAVDTTLDLKKDYTYTYIKYTDRGKDTQKTDTVSSITDAGDYDIKITFNGSYSKLGTYSVQLVVGKTTIGKLQISSTNGEWTDNTDNDNPVKYYLVDADSKDKKPTLVVKTPDGKTTLKEGTDYKVESALDKGGDEEKVTGKATVSILATSQNVTATDAGVAYNYCVVKTIKSSDITIALEKNGDNYKVTPSVCGSEASEHAPEWTYTIVNAKTLEKVSGSGDVKDIPAGDYIITVTGAILSGYNSTPVQKAFSISANTVTLNEANTKIQYAGKDSYVYTGKEITPAVKVFYTENGVKKDITSSVDVKWTNNINATKWDEDGDIIGASPEVTVSGKGNYIGTITKDNLDDEKQCIFEIKKADFEDVNVSVASMNFNGEAQTPEVKQVYNGVDVSDGSLNDVTIYECNVDSTGAPKYNSATKSWIKRDDDGDEVKTEDNKVTNAGYYVAKVGAGDNFNYSAEKEVVFQVKPYDISNLKAVINDGNALTTELTKNNIKFFNGKDVFKMNNAELGDADYSIDSSDKGKAGNYTVTIKGKDNYTGSLTASYTINEVITDENIFVYTTVDKDSEGNNVYTPHVNVYDNNSELIPTSSYTVKYYTGETITKDSEVKEFTEGGKYKVAVVPKGLYEGQKYSSYLESYYTAKEFTVATYDAEMDLNAAFVNTHFNEDFSGEYTGEECEPDIEVRNGKGDNIEAENYVVVYSNNVDVGTATVTVYGSNGYFGSASATFEIKQADVNKLWEKGAFDTNPVIYGTKYTDSDIFKSDKLGKDFKVVEYSKAVLDKNGLFTYNKDGSYATEGSYTADTIKDAGKYIALCEGIGNYKGTVQVVFDVDKLNLGAVDVKFDSMNYTGNKIVPTFTVMSGTEEITLSPEDYTVETYTNGAVTNAKDVVNPGSYWAKIVGKGNLDGENIGEFAIKAADLSKAKISVEAQTYTGEEIKPEISVTLDGNEVSSDLYEVTYADNIEVGTATVTVTAKGDNVTGTVSESFKINAIDLSDATVSDISAKTYNGKKQKPDVTVTLDGKVLEEGEDFSVSYKNNTSAGKATVKVSGIGNYKGSVAKTFTINRAGQKITVKGTSKTYKVKTLKAKKATFKLSATAKGSVSFKKLSSGKKVTVSKNGTVTVAKGLKKGTYKIKVKATAAATKTNYKAASKTFTVKVVVK